MFYTPAFVFAAIVWLGLFTLASSHVTFWVSLMFLIAGVVQWFCGALFIDALCEIKDAKDKKRSY